MFIGHWSTALAAAALPKAPRLGTLFIAGQLVDWGFFALVLADVEHMRITPGVSAMNALDLYYMPYTHSLMGTGLWAIAFTLILFAWQRSWMTAAIGGAVVLSHWVLDLLVHVPDLTLAGSPPKLGLGLWNYPAIEMPLEIALVLGGLWLFARKRGIPLRNPRLLALAGFLILLQAYNWIAPEPPEMDATLPVMALLSYGVATWLAARADVTPAPAA